MSTVRRLAFNCISGEGRLEKLLSKLQLLYEDSQKGLLSAGPSSLVVDDDLCGRELKSQVAMMEI